MLFDGEHLRTGYACKCRHGGYAQCNHQVFHIAAQRHNNAECQHEGRNTHDNIYGAHNQVVRLWEVCGDSTQQRAYKTRNSDAAESNCQRIAASVKNTAENVTSEIIRAEPML